eukprot:3734291-Rhodomonas_salina.1
MSHGRGVPGQSVCAAVMPSVTASVTAGSAEQSMQSAPAAGHPSQRCLVAERCWQKGEANPRACRAAPGSGSAAGTISLNQEPCRSASAGEDVWRDEGRVKEDAMRLADEVDMKM